MTIDYENSFGFEPKLPDDIREIFMWLCQDVAHIQSAWSFYVDLFTSNDYKEVADLAIESFRVVERALRTDITMSICRISDPSKSMKKENISFQTLSQKCGEIKGVDALFKDFSIACEPIIKLRHKRIGHNDLISRIDPLNNPLPGVGQKEINEILRLAKEILNKIIQYYVSVELSFNTIQNGGADKLLYWLKSGKQYHKDRRKRISHSTTN